MTAKRRHITAPHDGKRFSNLEPIEHASTWRFVWWMLSRTPPPFRFVGAPPGPAPATRVDDLRVTHVNHATVLIQTAGVNLLTDPIWSERCSPVSWAGPHRYRPPGLRFEDLPPIDIVLISHDHYDHLDLPTVRRLVEAHNPLVLTGLGNRARLKKTFARAKELDWWEQRESHGLSIHFVPAQHFSGRTHLDRDRTLWGGFVIEGPAGPVYFAGDTGMGSFFHEVRERFGQPRLALLPIGAYLPTSLMSPVHITPKEALDAHRMLGAHVSVGIHYGTFQLADDGQHQPVDDLRAALGDNPSERFVTLEHGMPYDVEPLETVRATSGGTGREHTAEPVSRR